MDEEMKRKNGWMDGGRNKGRLDGLWGVCWEMEECVWSVRGVGWMGGVWYIMERWKNGWKLKRWHRAIVAVLGEDMI